MWDRKDRIRCIAICFTIIFSLIIMDPGEQANISMNSTAMSSQEPIIWIELLNETITFEGDLGNGVSSISGALHYSFPVDYLISDNCTIYLDWNINNDDFKQPDVPFRFYVHNGSSGFFPFDIRFFKYSHAEVFSSSDGILFSIDGTWKMLNSTDNGDVGQVTAKIEFTPYCLFDSLYPVEDEIISGIVGEWIVIPITVINRGNTQMNVTIEAVSEDNIDYKIDKDSLTIPEGGESIVNLSVKQSKGLGRKNIVVLSFQGRAGESSDWESIGVPYKTSNTGGSLLLVNWWIFVIIILFVGLLLGIIVWKIRSKKNF
jgi:hypothetical protein